MRVIVCILLAIAGGFGAYILGAVVWSLIDPTGAGAALLFTIPIAIVGMAVPALLAVLALINRCDWSTAKRTSTRRAAPARKPVRKPVPFRRPQPELHIPPAGLATA